jgi:uncharacterized repeat protein (TIGR01451 family)/LPXTG-motif cell wall-anchored protein
MAPGASDSTTFTASYTLTQGDIDAGTFTNTATATGTPPSGPDVTDTDNDTQDFERTPGIELVKDGEFLDENQDGFAQPGETISYTFTVTNTGNVTLFEIDIDDAVTGVVLSGNPLAELAPGASDSSITGVYTITQDDVDAGMFENCATPLALDPNETPIGGAEDCTSDDLPRDLSIDLLKTGVLDDTNGDGMDSAGDTVNYTFTVTNTGNVTLTNVTITDPLVTVVGGPIATMAPGASDSTTFTATYVLAQGDIDAGTFTNTATVTGTDPDQQPVTDTDDDTQNFELEPGVELVKDGVFNDESQDGFAQPGETISYTFTVTNTGNVTLFDVDIDDAVAGVVLSGNPLAELLPGVSDSSITGVYTITQDDVDAGTFENCATPNALDPDGAPVSGAEDCTTDDLPQDPSINLIKTGDVDDTNGDGIDSAGDTVTYTFTVENTGNVTLTNVDIADTVGGVNVTGGPITTMAPGAVDATTFTGTYVVTQGNIDAGLFTNTATATGTPLVGPDVSDPDSDTQRFDTDPGMELVKNGVFNDESGDGFAQLGETIGYTFTVTNTGNVTLFDVDIDDAVAGVVLSGNPLAEVLPGVSDSSITGVYTITQDDVDAGTFENCATPLALGPDEEPVIGEEDCTTDDLPQDPSIDLVKTGTLDVGGDGVASPGDLINYDFTITNDGNVTLTGVILDDLRLDAPAVCDWGASSDPSTGVGVLLPAETVDCTGSYAISQEDIDRGLRRNIATATGTPPEGEDVTAQDEVTVTLEQTPAVSLVKTGTFEDESGDGFAQLGETITYTFTVENTGNVTLTDVTLVDDLTGVTIVGGPIVSMAPGDIDTITFTGSYVITQDDIDTGTFHNEATVTGTDPDEEPATGSDDEDVPLAQNPGISLFKNGAIEVGEDGRVDVGDPVVYTFTVENTGNVTLFTPSLTDLTFGDLTVTCPWDANAAFEFLPGFVNRVNCTATYLVTQADIDAGEIFNCALAEALTPSEAPVEDEDCFTLDEAQEPGIEIVKTALDPEINESESVTFNIDVTNTGNVTLNNVVVTDVLSPSCDRVFGAILVPGETVSYECTIDHVDESFTNVAVVAGIPPIADEEQPEPVTDHDDAVVTVLNPEFVVEAGVCLADDVGGVQLDRPYLAWDTTNWPAGAVLNIRIFDKDMNLYSEGTVVNSMDSMLWPGFDDSGFDPDTGIGGIVYPPEELRPIYIQIYTNPETPVTLIEYPAGTDGCTPNPAIEVVKEVTPDPITVGEATDVTWTVTVTNTGDSLLSDVELVDAAVPGCDLTIGILDAGESVEQSCIATYTADTADWTFDNTAVVTGTGPWGSDVTDDDTVILTAIAPNSIGDTVWNDVNQNGIQDDGEKGIAGALVTLTLPDGTTLTTTTDANGTYLFTDLGVGEFTVELDLGSIEKPVDGDFKLTTASIFTIVLEAGDVNLDADFGVVAVLPVTGIDTGNILAIALALLLAGATAVLITTRKRKDA